MTDPESRYNVLPHALRQARRAGASMVEIQIARACAYIARLEAELAPDAPNLTAQERKQKQQTLREWRAHLARLRADAAETTALRHAAE